MGKLVFLILFYGYLFGSWIVNLVKLLSCDFEAPWKDEIVHAIGLMPFVSMVTAWM